MTNHSIKGNTRNKFRIIGGNWRSRKLSFPEDVATLRPTPDRIRETLFNWLQIKISGARCLDLFAGSGALAFEALSRGAHSVIAIDQSSQVTNSLRDNCRLLACNDLTVVAADALHWLQQHAGKEQFDIIFLDPPYNMGLLPECIRLLDEGRFIAEGGVIYLEAGQPLENLLLPEHWQLLKSKKAGQVFYGVCESHII